MLRRTLLENAYETDGQAEASRESYLRLGLVLFDSFFYLDLRVLFLAGLRDHELLCSCGFELQHLVCSSIFRVSRFPLGNPNLDDGFCFGKLRMRSLRSFAVASHLHCACGKFSHVQSLRGLRVREESPLFTFTSTALALPYACSCAAASTHPLTLLNGQSNLFFFEGRVAAIHS